MYSLVVYVPESHCETLKQALFDAGAGRMGPYDQGCWQVLGQGQFRPLSGSSPYLGDQGELQVTAEVRLELVCEDHVIEPVIAALQSAHPYEMPAYHYVSVNT